MSDDNTENNNHNLLESIYKHIEQGVCIHKIVYKDKQAVDYRITDANPAYVKILGIPLSEAKGLLGSELYESVEPFYIGIYADVAETGKSTSFVSYYSPLEKHFNITVTSHEKGKFITIFDDITKIKNKQKKLREQERSGEYSLDYIPENIAVLDQKGIVQYTNKAWDKFTKRGGITASEIKAGTNYLNICKKQAESLPCSPYIGIKDVINKKKESFVMEYKYAFSENSKWYKMKATSFRKEGNYKVLITHEDITGQYTTLREKLKNSKKRLQNMLSAIPDLVSIHDKDMNIVYSNWKGFGDIDQDRRILGSKCYKTYRNYNQICPDCLAKEVFKTKSSFKKITKLDNDKWYEIRVIPIKDNYDNQSGKELFLEWVRDISELKKREEDIKYISFHDRITDLFNRSFMEQKIKNIDKKDNFSIGIILIDINGLKLVNSGYGHQAGDEMLKKTAELLGLCIGKKDILARWDGDQFIILLSQTNHVEVKKTVNKIQEKALDYQSNQNQMFSVGVGYAIKNDDKQDIYKVLYRAEDKLEKDKLTKNRSDKHKLVENLLNTLKAKSDETREHAERMKYYAHKLGEEIALENEDLNKLSLLANLHDIGKIDISEDILNKPDKLTKEEWQIIKTHPEKGYTIAKSTEEFSSIAESILYHHERWDGKGYPDGLSGEEIPILARIISIVDAYDVMTHRRAYTEPKSQKEAMIELKRCAGTQFDPILVDSFLNIFKD